MSDKFKTSGLVIRCKDCGEFYNVQEDWHYSDEDVQILKTILETVGFCFTCDKCSVQQDVDENHYFHLDNTGRMCDPTLDMAQDIEFQLEEYGWVDIRDWY